MPAPVTATTTPRPSPPALARVGREVAHAQFAARLAKLSQGHELAEARRDIGRRRPTPQDGASGSAHL